MLIGNYIWLVLISLLFYGRGKDWVGPSQQKNYTRRLFISARRTSWLGVLFDFVAVIIEAQCNEVGTIPLHVIGVRLLSQSAFPKVQSSKKEKKIPQTFAQLVHFSKMCLPYLRIIQSCYFDYRMKQLFACSRCKICVSRSVHLKSTYYVRKGS